MNSIESNYAMFFFFCFSGLMQFFTPFLGFILRIPK